MSKMIESTSNTNDTANVSQIILSELAATVILSSDSMRISFDINNNNANQGFWVRFYPAAQDNIKQGIFITNKNGSRPFYEMKRDNMYTGEISAISDNGNLTAYVTSF